MPAHLARLPPGPSEEAPARPHPAGPARPRAPLQPSRPRSRPWPAGSAPAGEAPACPGPRSPAGLAATTCRTPGSSAARSPPAGHRLSPRPAASHLKRPHIHPQLSRRQAQRVAAQQRGQAETTPQIRQGPAQRTQRVIRLPEQLAASSRRPTGRPASVTRASTAQDLRRAAAGTVARYPRSEETRAAAPPCHRG